MKSTMPTSHREPDRALELAKRLAALALFTVAAALLLSSWRMGVTNEASQMHYVAWLILHGLAPYRDIFEMNMPMTYLIHMAVISIFGTSDLGWRLFDYVTLGVVFACFVFFFPKGRRAAGLAAFSLFAIYHVLDGSVALGQRDYFLFVGLCGFLLSYRHAVRDEAGRHQMPLLILAGLCLGAATFIKPTAIVLFPACALHLYFVSRTFGGCVRAVLAFGSGGVIVALGVLGWLVAAGSLAAFIEILTQFLPIYSKVSQDFVLQGSRAVFALTAAGLLAPVAAMLIEARTRNVSAADLLRSEPFLALMMVTFAVASYIAQWKFFKYHLVPSVGFSFLALATLGDQARLLHYRRAASAAVLSLALLAAAANAYALRSSLITAFAFKRAPSVDKLIEDLDGAELRGKTVQPVDDISGVLEALFRTQRIPASRYIYGFPFFFNSDAPYIRSIRADFLTELERKNFPPLIIADEHYPRLMWSTAIDRWPEFAALLRTRYTMVRELKSQSDVKGYRIYVRRP